MYVVNKYVMVGLEDRCVNFLMQNLIVENICFVLESVYCFSKEFVRSYCVEFIKDCFGAFEFENFFLFCVECFRKVLLLDDLVMDEEEIFYRVMYWVLVQCQNLNLEDNGFNRRSVLDNCFYCIRFFIMSMQFFNEIVCKVNVLLEKEIEDVIR